MTRRAVVPIPIRPDEPFWIIVWTRTDVQIRRHVPGALAAGDSYRQTISRRPRKARHAR